MKIDAYREGESDGSRTRMEVQRPYAMRNLVVLSHMERPRGFGASRHVTTIAPESFADLAKMMVHANPEEAMKAFGCALRLGIPKAIEETKCWYPDHGYSN